MKAVIHIVAGVAAGQTVRLDSAQVFTAGRGADAQLSIPGDTALSRQHVRFEFAPPRLRVIDLGSRHGMFVNQARVTEAELRNGDHVQAGETVFRIELNDPMADTLVAAGMVIVRCRCGATAPSEPPRPGAEAVVYWCPRCQHELAQAPVLAPGYELVRVLGSGAMGCVYLARHQMTGMLRAIKQILPSAAMSQQMRTLFAREAMVQARLDHQHIVRIFDLVEPLAGSFSIVMEYVDGVSADTLISHGMPIAPGLAVAIGLQALDALAHAHDRQIVHRDIKEANLMLVRHPQQVIVKVADFGLAKNFQESGASGITRDGAMGGTIPYMPREQLLDFKYVKPSADIHALGATLYRLLTACYPRDFPEHANWIRIALEAPVVPLRARPYGQALPPALCAVIERALAPDAANRYRSAAEMGHALANVAG